MVASGAVSPPVVPDEPVLLPVEPAVSFVSESLVVFALLLPKTSFHAGSIELSSLVSSALFVELLTLFVPSFVLFSVLEEDWAKVELLEDLGSVGSPISVISNLASFSGDFSPVTGSTLYLSKIHVLLTSKKENAYS